MAIEELLREFGSVSEHPLAQLKACKAKGFKAVGVLPYYAPEELVTAAGMVPFGVWGSNKKTISRAKEYCASFYCTIAQLALEMLLDGTFDELDGLITPTICDTLRPMSQNLRVAAGKEHKCRTIFLAHPQNRKPAYGLEFCRSEYARIKAELEEIADRAITDDDIYAAIKLHNAARAAKREFVKLAALHPEAVGAAARSAVLRAGRFMPVADYTEKLSALNAELAALPESSFKGVKIVTSGIICDNPALLKILEDNKVVIAADDVASESRSFRTDVPEDADPLMALARQFAAQDYDVLLYDEESASNRRGEYVASLVKESGAKGLILFMQNFCDPEEMEYPSLKKALADAGIPHIKLGVEQQMQDFGQAATAIQAFTEILG